MFVLFEAHSEGRCLLKNSLAYASIIATALVHPADAPRILQGKQLTVKPVGGS
jgi:hypothetical protein